MRIALLSPYSWTYPGGVTRHIEALSAELTALGHDARILAPFDPDDALSRRLHRGARPQRLDPPERFVALGRTAGFPANGAISNLVSTPGGVLALRRELRAGGYDVLHIHEPVVPLLGWDALRSTAAELPLVGTFHTYSENVLTNGVGNLLGARRRMNHLHARIAVSEAAAWTARRFYGGRYRIVPNGVDLGAAQVDPLGEPGLHGDPGRHGEPSLNGSAAPLRILFIGQAVERKGLPVLLRAFEALREQVPATLTLVGASPDEVAHMMLDDRGVHALGKVSESRKLAELARAEVLCAPSLHGESFGMVLTEAFAAATPVLASDIPGYRDVVRDGVEGLLTPPGDALALAEALRSFSLDPAARARMAAAARLRAERFAWPHVAAEVLDCYEQALAVGRPATRAARVGVRLGLVPADLLPRVPAQRLPSLETATVSTSAVPDGSGTGGRERSRLAQRALRRLALVAVSLGGLALALLALVHIGVGQVAASLLASSPGLLLAGLGLMCASMFARAIAWHAILAAAPTWRKARRRDAMQGTFIGVLMSATLPARLGEPSRALIVARRLGRARETLPVVLGTMVSQTLLNLLALAILGIAMFSSVDLFNGHHGALVAVALAPVGAVLVVLLAPVLLPSAAVSRSLRLQVLMAALRASLVRVREGLRVFRHPRQAALATTVQLGAWGLQWVACWLLLMALGLAGHVGIAGAAAVLFAVNVTAVIPATPANIGVFQAACVAVLVGAYHVSTPDALAYGIVLQVVEVAAAVLMGIPALITEGLSWKDVRLRTMSGAPVKLSPLPAGKRSGVAKGTASGVIEG
ncbi:MAG TPA: lysylphosphatidylglycerol synthase domain-containing protein [Solirubrobacteraceae bacterium]|nr:lysylphosphatidylglycerol synthase domain-containing protein [Solirubrobacteraceae bacterium]